MTFPIVSGSAGPDGSTVTIRDGQTTYTGRGFTLDDAGADAVRKRNAAEEAALAADDEIDREFFAALERREPVKEPPRVHIIDYSKLPGVR